MRVAIIAAVAENRAIGKNNDLIWNLPADMGFFQRQTRGHVVITGRRNYESIPEKYRPLPNRTNVVITRNPLYAAPGAAVVPGLSAAIERAKTNGGALAFIIGGGQIYAESLRADVVDELVITHVHASFPEADVYFPEVDYEHWQRVEAAYHPKDDQHNHAFTISRYIRKPADG